MKKTKIDHYTDKEALEFHSHKKPGKIEIIASKNMTTKRDLALAYSPGVAVPVKKISENPEAAYDYTSKGNLVAVISNGSAILGMGDLGALASKPVMEGKAVLFKRFADIDSIDLEIDSKNTDEIINSIKNFAPSFGGINLEDIAAPDCFIIEEKLKETLDIPVFHDDQHGTAIITTAALINALDINKKEIDKIKIVINGAGASAMACANLFKKSGVPQKNITMIDRKGVIYRGRGNLNQWKSSHAIETTDKTLDDIDLIAYTAGPGLKGCLLVGSTFARSLAYITDKPIISVNHIEAHLLAPFMEYPELSFPFFGLLISGGHTMIVDAKTIGLSIDPVATITFFAFKAP